MNDYFKGLADCERGIPAQQNASDDYNKGYSEQYIYEQIQDYLTQKQDEELH